MDESNSLSPMPSNASSGPIPNATMVSSYPTNTNSSLTGNNTLPSLSSSDESIRTRYNTGLNTLQSNASLGSGLSDGFGQTYPGSLTGNNINNAITGTGTYAMGKKKIYHSNHRADHSGVNENQLSTALTPSSITKATGAQSIIDNFIVVSEKDLPFSPDTIESVISLLDMLIVIYRSVAQSLEDSSNMSKTELTEIDLALASVEIILRRTIITEGLVMLDAEYLKRREPRSRDVLERDIIRVCSQPNANNAGKSSNFLGKMAEVSPLTVTPRSQAMYV